MASSTTRHRHPPQQQHRQRRRHSHRQPLSCEQTPWILPVTVCLAVTWCITLCVLHSMVSSQSSNNSSSLWGTWLSPWWFGETMGRLHRHRGDRHHPSSLRRNKDADSDNAAAFALRSRFEALDARHTNLTYLQAFVQQQLHNPNLQLPPNALACPNHPSDLPASYPVTWPLLDILKAWNPNRVQLPLDQGNQLFYSLCVLDWTVHSRETVSAYRQAEVPFVLRNHPQVLQATFRWNANHVPSLLDDSGGNVEKKKNNKNKDQPYLWHLLGSEPPQRNEYARRSNHLAFWRGDMKHPPTQNIKLTVYEWWQHATELEQQVQELKQQLKLNGTAAKDADDAVSQFIATSDHYYYRLSATDQVRSFLYNELPIFQGDENKNEDADIFMPEPDAARGLNCRLGMAGSMADNHFDPTRNWILNLKGNRRYILSPPEQCPNLNLHPLRHPSARHSRGNWAQPSSSWDGLQQAQSTQVVLQPGEALYLPTSWFHFIVSLSSTSFQCNARSGTTHTPGSALDQIFTQCGFAVSTPDQR